MAQYLDKDPFTYEHEKRTFLNDLRQFHSSKGTPLNRLPCIGGKELDLYLLYNKVVSLGGFTKVSDQELWESLLEFFGLPPFCGQGGYALRQIYTRHLVAYERINHGGEDTEEVLRGEGGRVSMSLSTAQKFSYGRSVPENVRLTTCMETALAKLTDYDKLKLSLECGLPNEIDFALNVCTLLSNESKHVLHLEQEPRLVDLLLAHVGIFLEGAGSYRNVYQDSWKGYTNRDFVKFWYDSVQDKEIREVIGPDSKKPKDINKFTDSMLFAQRTEGINDIEKNRILQVGIILRNLSFEQHNQHVMARHRTLYRFLLLCSHNDCSTLKHIGMDTLSNIAELFNLDPIDYRSSQLMFHTIYKGLYDKDKYVMLRAMEIVEKLCKTEANSEILIECLERRLYDRVVTVLTIHDIQLLLGALELLLVLSEKGEVTCTHIVACDRSIDVLVCLVTLDAQSLGQDAFIGIKIVDHAPDGIHHPIVTMNQGSMAQVRAPMPTPMNPQQQQMVPQVGAIRTQSTPIQRPPPPIHMARSSPLARPPSQSPVPTPNLRTVPPSSDTENESFACQWLNACYEAAVNGRVARTDLYANYLSACNKASQRAILSSTHFGRCLKAVFPKVTYQRTETPEGPQYHILGVNKRALPLPLMPSLPQPLQAGIQQRPNFVSRVASGSPQITPSPPLRYPATPQSQGTSQPVQYYALPQTRMVNPLIGQPRMPQGMPVNVLFKSAPQTPQMVQQRPVMTQQGCVQQQGMIQTIIRPAQGGMTQQVTMVQQPGMVQQAGAPPNQGAMVQQPGMVVQPGAIQQPTSNSQPCNTQQPMLPTTNNLVSMQQPGANQQLVFNSTPTTQNQIPTPVVSPLPSVPSQEAPSQPKPPSQPGTTPKTPASKKPARTASNTPQKPEGGSPKKPGTITGVGTPHKAQAPEHPPIQNGEVQIERVPNIHVQHIPPGMNIQLANSQAPGKVMVQGSGVITISQGSTETVTSQQLPGSSPSALHQALCGNQIPPSTVQGDQLQIGQQPVQHQANANIQPIQQKLPTLISQPQQQVKPVPIQPHVQSQPFMQNIQQQQIIGQISSTPHQTILSKPTFVQTNQAVNQNTLVARPMQSSPVSQSLHIQNQQVVYQRPIAPAQPSGLSRYQAIAPKRPNPSQSPKQTGDSPLIKKLLQAGPGLKAFVSNPNLLNRQQQQQQHQTVVQQAGQPPNQMVLQHNFQMQGQQQIVLNQQMIFPNQQFIQQQSQSVPSSTNRVILSKPPVSQPTIMITQPQIVLTRPPPSSPHALQIQMHPQKSPQPKEEKEPILEDQEKKIELIRNEGYRKGDSNSTVEKMEVDPSSNQNGDVKMEDNSQASDELESNDNDEELINGTDNRSVSTTDSGINGNDDEGKEKIETLLQNGPTKLTDNILAAPEKIQKILKKGAKAINALSKENLLNGYRPEMEVELTIQRVEKPKTNGNPLKPVDSSDPGIESRPGAVNNDLKANDITKGISNGIPNGGIGSPLSECSADVDIHGTIDSKVVTLESERTLPSEKSVVASNNIPKAACDDGGASPSHAACNTEKTSEGIETRKLHGSHTPPLNREKDNSSDTIDTSQLQTQGTNCQSAVPASSRKSKLPSADNGQIDGKGLKRLLETANNIPVSTIPCKIGVATTAERRRRRSSSSSTSSKKSTSRKSSMPAIGLYLCEWKGCKKSFNKAKSLWVHSSKAHVTSDSYRGVCEWNGCDRVKRQVWSCVSHLQDKHCTEVALAAASAKRTEQMLRQTPSTPSSHTSSPSPQPAPVVYNAHNAYHAIRRSLHVPALKDLLGEPEGPVTKSIRITAALILKNIAKYSSEGRSILRRHEFHLARIVISQAESSSTLAKCLEEMQKDS
ncbi:SWI/SNF nucleosome remodeling complex component-like [Anneissia japonica]|uniref:SWI/SNF nucleosome remodeling complex component-like n=1 Tax=Anneissia japonica TaxID=1529436 RepID=UPI001425ADB7|nr:SWI/SNF nucleosome remodeling complex component-like [Anneissia japonica]